MTLFAYFQQRAALPQDALPHGAAPTEKTIRFILRNQAQHTHR